MYELTCSSPQHADGGFAATADLPDPPNERLLLDADQSVLRSHLLSNTR